MKLIFFCLLIYLGFSRDFFSEKKKHIQTKCYCDYENACQQIENSRNNNSNNLNNTNANSHRNTNDQTNQQDLKISLGSTGAESLLGLSAPIVYTILASDLFVGTSASNGLVNLWVDALKANAKFTAVPAFLNTTGTAGEAVFLLSTAQMYLKWGPPTRSFKTKYCGKGGRGASSPNSYEFVPIGTAGACIATIAGTGSKVYPSADAETVCHDLTSANTIWKAIPSAHTDLMETFASAFCASTLQAFESNAQFTSQSYTDVRISIANPSAASTKTLGITTLREVAQNLNQVNYVNVQGNVCSSEDWAFSLPLDLLVNNIQDPLSIIAITTLRSILSSIQTDQSKLANYNLLSIDNDFASASQGLLSQGSKIC